MSDILLCPSTMCLDFSNLKEEIKALEEAGTDIFHNDIMDGNFVPNMTLGINDLKAIRKLTNKKMDVHLMVNNPGTKIDWFMDAGVDLIYIHPESEKYVIRTLQRIQARGIEAGIAINPDTSIETIKELLYVADYVMVMSVTPGFAGQKYLEFVNHKIKTLCAMKKDYGYKVIIDGAVSPERVKELNAVGVDGYILGTSSIFGKDRSYKEIMEEIRTL